MNSWLSEYIDIKKRKEAFDGPRASALLCNFSSLSKEENYQQAIKWAENHDSLWNEYVCSCQKVRDAYNDQWMSELVYNLEYCEVLLNLFLERAEEVGNKEAVKSLGPVEFLYITDDRTLAENMPVFKNSTVLGVDTETTGLNPLTDKIRLLQMAVPDGPIGVIDMWGLTDLGKSLVREILASSSMKVFHNAKFDMKFLTHEGFEVEGTIFDTMVAAKILDAGIKKAGFRLNDLVKEYLSMELPKELQSSNWSQELNHDQLEYAAKDAAILLELVGELELRLNKSQLREVFELECLAIGVVASIELNGMFLDLQALQNLSENLEQVKTEKEQALYELLEGSHIPLPETGLNLNSSKQMLTLFQDMGIPVVNTNKETLIPLAEQYPIIGVFLEYRKVSKALQAFSTKLSSSVHPLTKRIHPQYNQLGAATGRFSCSKPNLQQIPRTKDFRACFIPEPGNKMVIADYSQIELRVAAEISQDEQMMKAYKEGEDLHRLTAALIADKPLDQVSKEERQAAKAVNFGLIYAMGAEGLAAYAKASYGVDMTKEQAETFRDRFFKAYQGVYRWHRAVKQANLKETRTLSGRLRRWEEPPRLTELYNTPVQGTAADIVKRALIMLPGELKSTGAKIIGMVHDEIILEVPEDQAENAAKILRKVMVEAGSYYLNVVPVEAEVIIADSWADK